MGVSTDGILAYGYDLGCGDDWKVRQVGEYGDLAVDWYNPEADDAGFTAAAERRLLDSVGFTETWEDGRDGYFQHEKEAVERLGVELETHCSDEYQMYILAAKVITACRGDLKTLDLAALAREPAEHGWDGKLAAALEALGLTPTQERPAWLLCSYWG